MNTGPFILLHPDDNVLVCRQHAFRGQSITLDGDIVVLPDEITSYIDGITDISCPVINDVGVVAALTMPWIHIEDGIPLDDALVRLKATAKTLSKSLGG